jgi:hypothetical protein
LVNILEGDGGNIKTGSWANNACTVVFPFSVILRLIDSLSLPSHPTNSYPSLGAAVIVISVPSSYVPPSDDTVPPSPAETVKVYCVGSGVAITLGGGVVSSSSAEQL